MPIVPFYFLFFPSLSLSKKQKIHIEHISLKRTNLILSNLYCTVAGGAYEGEKRGNWGWGGRISYFLSAIWCYNFKIIFTFREKKRSIQKKIQNQSNFFRLRMILFPYNFYSCKSFDRRHLIHLLDLNGYKINKFIDFLWFNRFLLLLAYANKNVKRNACKLMQLLRFHNQAIKIIVTWVGQ